MNDEEMDKRIGEIIRRASSEIADLLISKTREKLNHKKIYGGTFNHSGEGYQYHGYHFDNLKEEEKRHPELLHFISENYAGFIAAFRDEATRDRVLVFLNAREGA